MGGKTEPCAGPKPADDELTELERCIQDQLDGRIGDVKLDLVPGGLVLRGRTRTYHAKQLAQQALMQASDRPLVANEIEVC